MTRAVPAGPPASGVIEITGNESGTVVVDFPRPVELLSFSNLGDRPHLERPGYIAGQTKGAYAGWYMQRLPGLEPVAGFLTVRGLDRDLGEPLPVSLVRKSPQVIPPGRYRVMLLGDGPSTAFIRTIEDWVPSRLHAATPHGVVSSGVLGWDVPGGHSASPVVITDPVTGIYELEWHAADLAGASHSVICITPSPDITCALSATTGLPGGGGGFHVGGPGTRFAGVGVRHREPGEIPPGDYNFVLLGGGANTSGRAFMIALPGAAAPAQ